MQKKRLNKKIVITGGGSGGHVTVATALINELENQYENLKEQLLYIGGDLSMVGDTGGKSIEQKRFEKSDYSFKAIRAGKLQRIFSISSIKLLFRSLLGFLDAYKYLKEFKPDLIISTGGYVAVPVAISSYFLKIPLYIHEQTAAVGLTNSISSKIAKKIFVTFPESLKFFPKERTTITGNPIRGDIFRQNKGTPLLDSMEEMIKVKDVFPIIYISGGGLGSHKINVAVRDTLIHLLEKYQIILQTGDNSFHKDFDVLTTEWGKLPKELQKKLFVTKYVTDQEIGSVFNNINLFIGRSGANTVYELGVLKIPCILIPIPWVTHNEQEKNAKILEKVGLATILLEGTLSRDTLIQAIDVKIKSIGQVTINENELNELFPMNAAAKIINSIKL